MNLAIFDLDGTLWTVNSHVDIVKKYYGKKYDCILIKIYRKIFFDSYMKWLHKCFDKIPDTYVNNYKPMFNKRMIELLQSYESKCYKVVIISNAPQRILDTVHIRLEKQVYRAEIGKKDKVVRQFEYDKLFVVTDNITDWNIIKMANRAIVIITSSNRHFFSHKKQENIEFIVD